MSRSGSAGAKGRGGPGRRIDALAMGQFIQALSRGASVEGAARAAGFDACSFYRRRRADPDFAEAWTEAAEASDAPMLIKPFRGRRLQLRKTRCLRFTQKKKDLFLSHFAGTCDRKAAAEAAGVSVTTVRYHRLRDPEFDAACAAALEQGYRHLEEEAVRERLAATERLKKGIVPAGEVTAEFERQMKLLAQWRRRDGRLGPMTHSRETLKRWSFDEAMNLLEKRLKALKIPIERPGPEGEE